MRLRKTMRAVWLAGSIPILAAVGWAARAEAPSPSWAAYDLAELADRRVAEERTYLEFLRVPTLRAGVYALDKGGDDRQRPHAQDELYYVSKGRARLAVGDSTVRVGPGSIVYVRAGEPHRFVDIEEDLEVLVFFSTAEAHLDQPAD